MNRIRTSQNPKAALQDLPPVKNRYTFLYLEKCILAQSNYGLKASWKEGYSLIPVHAFLVLLLGPGTSLTHRAAQLIGESGAALVWVGDCGNRLYGFGRPLSSSSVLLMRQALCASKPRLHMEVVRRMYSLRFGEEETSDLTLSRLRGKEGARMKKEYQKQAGLWKIPWSGREYDPENFQSSNPVNQALSAANSCLYGLSAAVISALGLSWGIGFIHTGHERSFVYDIADLYKAELTIPMAFEIASRHQDEIPRQVRREFRKRVYGSSLVKRMIQDIKYVLDLETEEADLENTLFLWDGTRDCVEAGIQYHLSSRSQSS